MVAAMERASGRAIKYVIGERRPGDLDEVYSDPSKVIKLGGRFLRPSMWLWAGGKRSLDPSASLIDRSTPITTPCLWLGRQAERELGWKATRNLDDMTRDLWRWQQSNPNGYRK